MLKVFEAFSGIGTQRMALRNIGLEHEVVGISEISESAITAYNAIHGETKNFGDISKLDIKDIPDHDLFTYSFPCQDISLDGRLSGVTEGSGTRSSLLWEAKRVIEVKKPRYLMLENVKNLLASRFKDDFETWLNWLESQGYNNYVKLINAKDFTNIPQNRERVFVLSILKEDDFGFSYPDNIARTSVLKDFLDNPISHSFIVPESKFEKLIVPFESKVERHFVANNKTGYIVARPYDSFVYGYPNSTTRRGRVGYGVAQTIQTEVMMGVVLEDFTIKKFTPSECWRLMGVKDEDYFKAVNAGLRKTALYELAGNAIVVPVLERIFQEVLKNESARSRESEVQ